MKTPYNFTLAVLALTVAGSAGASTITIEAAKSSLGSQSSAAAYKSAVDAALASGGKSAPVASYDSVSTQNLFGLYSDYAYKSTVNFDVSASNAGLWDIRSGVDFGLGGALYVDGVAYTYKSNDMWWAGNYNNSSAYLSLSLALGSGAHTLTMYGLEDCCSGAYQMQFKNAAMTSYTSFSLADGLIAAPVPEPATYAMLLSGLGLIGFAARRKSRLLPLST